MLFKLLCQPILGQTNLGNLRMSSLALSLFGKVIDNVASDGSETP